MAIIRPDGWRELIPTGAAARELETLQTLANGLPDSYTIYHGVHWSRVEQGTALFGEVAFALVNPAGQVLLIEQQSGFLTETAEGLVKRHRATEKPLPARMVRARDTLLARLMRSESQATIHIDTLLYCPDYRMKDPGSAGIDPSRIVDASRSAHLVDIIRALLPDDLPSHPDVERIHRFLADELRLVPDVSAIVNQSRILYTRLSGGLAYWARQIDCRPFRLRVVGTAGSGKTQLALSVLRDASGAGRRALYVCYNRPLADHIALIAPTGCSVATYHQLCDRILRATGKTPDFSQPDAFQTLECFMAAFRPDENWLFDEIVVDEGQDFQPAWKDNLLKLVRPEGRAWWLEDPMQNLYGRVPLELPGWVTIRAEINYRSPKEIVAAVDRLPSGHAPIRAGSPLSGSQVEILSYAGPSQLMDRTKTAITRGLGAGFGKDMMALITFRGREHSQFTALDRLGPHTLKAFTGHYDLFGSPVYSQGELFIDSVYRFKGQSAPCVIFTEIDFDTLDEIALRKLFVGMTRASHKLILVLSENALSALDASARIS